MTNPQVAMSLDDCVEEVMGMLTGLDMQYRPELDRYRAVTRQINRALRANAREREWSYYSSREDLGLSQEGQQAISIAGSLRPRIIGDDALILADDDERPVVWAFFLPRDAIEKYPARRGLWVSSTRQTLRFSRPLLSSEAGLHIMVPCMREPRMFKLPQDPTDAEGELVTVPDSVRNQLLDFHQPDVVLQRAAYYYAMTDPVLQPRAQTLENEYKQTFYTLNERDDRNTDHPYLNEFHVPIQGDRNATSFQDWHHPLADDRM